MYTAKLYNTLVVIAAMASATVAVWHHVIGAGTYSAIVVGALGIGGVVHKNGNGAPPTQ